MGAVTVFECRGIDYLVVGEPERELLGSYAIAGIGELPMWNWVARVQAPAERAEEARELLEPLQHSE